MHNGNSCCSSVRANCLTNFSHFELTWLHFHYIWPRGENNDINSSHFFSAVFRYNNCIKYVRATYFDIVSGFWIQRKRRKDGWKLFFVNVFRIMKSDWKIPYILTSIFSYGSTKECQLHISCVTSEWIRHYFPLHIPVNSKQKQKRCTRNIFSKRIQI